MPQGLGTSTIDEFSFDDLDLSSLEVVSMHDSVALPESGASSCISTSMSSCCLQER